MSYYFVLFIFRERKSHSLSAAWDWVVKYLHKFTPFPLQLVAVVTELLWRQIERQRERGKIENWSLFSERRVYTSVHQCNTGDTFIWISLYLYLSINRENAGGWGAFSVHTNTQTWWEQLVVSSRFPSSLDTCVIVHSYRLSKSHKLHRSDVRGGVSCIRGRRKCALSNGSS